jgi:hypothetical protein
MGVGAGGALLRLDRLNGKTESHSLSGVPLGRWVGRAGEMVVGGVEWSAGRLALFRCLRRPNRDKGAAEGVSEGNDLPALAIGVAGGRGLLSYRQYK